jgi:acrylyl-CoA reductase (NADPH)
MTSRALFLTRESDGPVTACVSELDDTALPDGDVTIDVDCSSLNYKDAMIIAGHPGLVRDYPHVPGIDLAGTVRSSDVAEFRPGDEVLVTGCWLGERHWGGMATRARVPVSFVVRRPGGMDARRAMALGTAGFTAQLSVDALMRGGALEGDAPVLVTGASGGVGSLSVHLLAQLGVDVVASTGRSGDETAVAALRALGASTVIDRSEVTAAATRQLASARWAGVVDVAGGATLAGALAQTAQRGIVAACGLVDDVSLVTSVMPFIVRGVTLVGIDSVLHPMQDRPNVWRRLHDTVDDDVLQRLTTVIPLEGAADHARRLLAGQTSGRVVIDTGIQG